MARPQRNPLQAQGAGLEKVKHILAVSSCKGGVGKSTMACNLAYALHQLGHKVGIFDADVYGPSLPTLVHIQDPQLYQVEGMIRPLEREGVKLMSFGYIPKPTESQAAIMRGPMATQVINQLLTGTDWGELDFLVIDMPPGTGDVVLTLTQLIPITAAVIVTTPQQLSFIDVVKGISMFDKLEVPTLGVIENMSYFEPEPGGKRYYLFGKGARKKLVEQYGFEHSFELPIYPELAEWSDQGRPILLSEPESEVARRFLEVARALATEVERVKAGLATRPVLDFEAGRGFLLTLANGDVYEIDPVDLRLACRGAHTVDEFTGEPLIRREEVPADIHPEAIHPMGNYAVTVQWSHGHPASIYPYAALETLVAGAKPVVNIKARFEV